MLEMTRIRAEKDAIITALKKRNIDVTETIDASPVNRKKPKLQKQKPRN